MNTKLTILRWTASGCFMFVFLSGLMAHGTESGEGEPGPAEGAVLQSLEHEVHQSPDGKLTVEMMINPVLVEGAPVSMSLLIIEEGAQVAEHTHESSVEMLYIMEGGGVVTILGVAHELSPGSSVYIPAGAAHSYINNSGQQTRALQVYAGPGPEARFRNWAPPVGEE